jgi:hypothetical protein
MGDEHLVKVAGFAEETGVNEDGIEIAEKGEQAVSFKTGLSEDQAVDDDKGEDVGRDEPRPVGDGVVVEEEDKEADKGAVALGSVIDKGVAGHAPRKNVDPISGTAELASQAPQDGCPKNAGRFAAVVAEYAEELRGENENSWRGAAQVARHFGYADLDERDLISTCGRSTI